MNIPGHLEHMSEEPRNNVGVMCFLFKIHNKMEVRLVFGLVCCGCERDIYMFTGDPLVEVIFNLRVVLAMLEQNENVMSKTRLTTVCTNAMVAIGRASFSENSGCITPSSSLFLNQILLIRV